MKVGKAAILEKENLRRYGQERAGASKNVGMEVTRRHVGGRTARKEADYKFWLGSTAGVIIHRTKCMVSSVRVIVWMWCLLWVSEVRRVCGELGFLMALSGREEDWYSNSYTGEWSGGRREEGWSKLYKIDEKWVGVSSIRFPRGFYCQV